MFKTRVLIYFIGLVLFIAILNSCIHVKPYQKEYLVHPLMDDVYLGNMDSDFKENIRSKNEKLGTTTLSSSSTSCPTCGG